MSLDYLEMLLRLFAALLAGGLIGLERSHRGRPAGFRTHALVCLASSLLMLVTAYEAHWTPVGEDHHWVLDPTRMAQGIMTGIGFVGAGAIIKEGFSVRGLTTAASIWVTAAIGILAGIGFYFAAAAGTVLALGTLSLFRWVESRLPTEAYANFTLRCRPGAGFGEPELRKLLASHRLSLHTMSYRLHGEAGVMEFRTVLRSLNPADLAKLAVSLQQDPRVLDYRIAPTSE